MDPISDVVDEVIQSCPIDVRRPLYKVQNVALYLWIIDGMKRFVSCCYREIINSDG